MPIDFKLWAPGHPLYTILFLHRANTSESDVFRSFDLFNNHVRARYRHANCILNIDLKQNSDAWE